MKLTYFDFGLGVTGMVPTSEAVHRCKCISHAEAHAAQLENSKPHYSDFSVKQTLSVYFPNSKNKTCVFSLKL